MKIKNVGPIEEAELTLNRVNVFMGPQSSGKSTIAKIISFCTWVEKDIATSQSLDECRENADYFKKHLEEYHKLKGYFKSNSYISYISDVIKIEYDNEKFSIAWKEQDSQYTYKRSKISYIPSERNTVFLPEMKKMEFSNNSIRSFLFDWFDTRKNYSRTSGLSILNLGVDYYYSEKTDEDRIAKKHNGDSYDISLSNASSGLQSITPLISMVDYLTSWIYEQEDSISFEWNDRKRQTMQILSQELIFKKYFKDSFTGSKEQMKEMKEKMKTSEDEQFNKLLENCSQVAEMLFSTHNSQLIIEEPEQNLFPETQRDLIYYLLKKCLNSKREHCLTITTHSPYVLYALNNCMLGRLVSCKEEIKCGNALVEPKLVSVYEIHNGILERIQQDDGLVSKNYFDENMKELMDDFYAMLNYYG